MRNIALCIHSAGNTNRDNIHIHIHDDEVVINEYHYVARHWNNINTQTVMFILLPSMFSDYGY